MKNFLVKMFFFTVFVGLAQTDVEFMLHESAVNKVLQKTGEISGTSDYEVFVVRGKYHWKVKELQVRFHPVKSTFQCVAEVKAGLVEYSTPVNGWIDIRYDSLRDKILLVVKKADFEVYTLFAGRKIVLTTIHLEKYFKEPFEFDGPSKYSTMVEVPVSDTIKKKIYIRPEKCRLLVLTGKLLLRATLNVSDVPFMSKPDSLGLHPAKDTLSLKSTDKK